MIATILASTSPSNLFGYAVGAVLAMGILAYLVYTLVKPEKF